MPGLARALSPEHPAWTLAGPVSSNASAAGSARARRPPAHLQRAQRLVHVAADGEVVHGDVLQLALHRDACGVGAGEGFAPAGVASPKSWPTPHQPQRRRGGQTAAGPAAGPGRSSAARRPKRPLPACLRVDEVQAAQRDAGVPLEHAVPRRHLLGHVSQDGDLRGAGVASRGKFKGPLQLAG